jgi:hypothetical protein
MAMSETELTKMLDDALRMIDEQRAHFVGLNGSERAIESEMWFRREIAKALAPLTARIEAIEKKPSPAPTVAKPSAALLGAIGHEIAERDKRIEVLEQRLDALEKQIEKIERRQYVGVWSTGKLFEQGQFCTHDNSMWHCNVDGTEQRPGTGPDWTLAIKRGRDGKDGADASRRPTVQRSGGPVMS